MTLHRSQCKITWSHLWSEPFRVFFPAGLAIGMVGVSLWPAYYACLLSFYPGVAHARLMIQGFMASFIVGFLGTAGPRITSTRPFSRVEVLTLLTLDLFAVGLHCGAANRADSRTLHAVHYALGNGVAYLAQHTGIFRFRFRSGF